MSKFFKKALSFAPMVLPFVAPGLGTAIGAALGAGSAAAPIVGNAALGAGLGGLSGGGVKGALIGGATGALGAAAPSILGSAAGTSLDAASGVAGMQGPTQGSGLIGGATRALGTNAGTVGSGLTSLAGSGSPLNLGSTMLSTLNQAQAQKDAEEQLLAAQGRAESAMAPYTATGAAANDQLAQRLQAGFQPGDLTQDPGYQFQLQQGQEALNKQLAAQGGLDSGRALKAATEYSQGLADQTYQNAYNRWLQENQQIAGQAGQGLNATGAMADIYGTQGLTRANATMAGSNLLNNTLSQLLSGTGAKKKQIAGYDYQGNPIYVEV